MARCQVRFVDDTCKRKVSLVVGRHQTFVQAALLLGRPSHVDTTPRDLCCPRQSCLADSKAKPAGLRFCSHHLHLSALSEQGALGAHAVQAMPEQVDPGILPHAGSSIQTERERGRDDVELFILRVCFQGAEPATVLGRSCPWKQSANQ